MMSNASVVNVALTARDIQWLVTLEACIATFLNPTTTDSQVDQNVEAAETLYMLHYSEDEAIALRDRLRALLPPDSPLMFVKPQFPVASNATLQS